MYCSNGGLPTDQFIVEEEPMAKFTPTKQAFEGLRYALIITSQLWMGNSYWSVMDG